MEEKKNQGDGYDPMTVMMEFETANIFNETITI